MNTMIPTAARPVKAVHRDGVIHVTLADDHTINFPVTASPRLAAATPAQLENVELLPFTLHWPDVDEDITIESLIELGHGR
jgi:Protein of unknown function (DUF2442)